ncbi:hypothetical protein BT93_F2387 [Corymbia citriodora subsp. variegata]|nr:hypothetical protein BT93_F2387 [Corymbia citriodora subsp. variegata]
MRNLMDTNLKMAPAPAPIPDKNVTDGIMQFRDRSKQMLVKIELLVIIIAILLLFLATFGSCRRRCSSGVFRLVIFAAYTLSTYIFTYALGLMQDAPFYNELFPVWAVFLVIILGSTDSISAYSLEDNERWKSYNWQAYIKIDLVALFGRLEIRRQFQDVGRDHVPPLYVVIEDRREGSGLEGGEPAIFGEGYKSGC